MLDWFKEWIGYPAEAEGVLVSGGSAANMTALACAREALLGAMSERVVAYVSDQAHSSVARAARVLGFRPEQVRVLPTDERFRMRPDALADAMDADLRAGRRPLFVSASAGSTNTGAVDPLPELAEICEERGAWLHVDAGLRRLRGADRARQAVARGDRARRLGDARPAQVALPAVRVRLSAGARGHYLREAFEITPDYLKDTEVLAREVNFADRGVQLSRMCRALKLWVSLQVLRRRRVPGGDRPLPRPGARGAERGSRRAASSSSWSPPRSASCASGGASRAWTTRTSWRG